MAKKSKGAVQVVAGPTKLDFGCGPHKREGFHGVDSIAFPGVDTVLDVRQKWPWADSSVEEAHASHFLEHLTGVERVHFVNELYRVLKPGGKATIITPHWASCRAYGDYTHQWPPVSEFWFYYLSKPWRDANAPHDDLYTCDFSASWGYSMREDLTLKNQEMQQFAMQNYKEVCQDMIATIVSLKK